MKIAIEEISEAYILKLQGELDAFTCLQIDKEIEIAMRKPISQLWVDCQGLEYISSAGLGVFISNQQILKKRGVNFVFYNMKKHIYSIFVLLGLHDILTIVPTQKESELALPTL